MLATAPRLTWGCPLLCSMDRDQPPADMDGSEAFNKKCGLMEWTLDVPLWYEEEGTPRKSDIRRLSGPGTMVAESRIIRAAIAVCIKTFTIRP